jgi:hypothetical protein
VGVRCGVDDAKMWVGRRQFMNAAACVVTVERTVLEDRTRLRFCEFQFARESMSSRLVSC